MLLYQTSPQLEHMLERVMVDEQFRTLSEEMQPEVIYEIIHTLSKAQQEMKWTNHPRIFLEVVMVQLCQQFMMQANGADRLQAIMNRMQQLEKELEQVKRMVCRLVCSRKSEDACSTKASTDRKYEDTCRTRK